MWYENNECSRKSLNIWTPLCTLVVKVVLIINHIKKYNLFLCNHIIHNMQAFNISCYWHIRKYFYQRFDNFMKADNEWGKLCNNLSLKRIHNIHSWNLTHSEVLIVKCYSNATLIWYFHFRITPYYDAEIIVPFALLLYFIVSNICYLVERVNYPFINRHTNRIMTNIIEPKFGLLFLIFGTRKKCL